MYIHKLITINIIVKVFKFSKVNLQPSFLSFIIYEHSFIKFLIEGKKYSIGTNNIKISNNRLKSIKHDNNSF